MIIARGESVGGATQSIILGLSRGNVEKLMEGKPIRITRQSHGEAVPLGWSVFIMFGETEQAMYDELKSAGALEGSKISHLPPGAK